MITATEALLDLYPPTEAQRAEFLKLLIDAPVELPNIPKEFDFPLADEGTINELQ